MASSPFAGRVRATAKQSTPPGAPCGFHGSTPTLHRRLRWSYDTHVVLSSMLATPRLAELPARGGVGCVTCTNLRRSCDCPSFVVLLEQQHCKAMTTKHS